MTTFEAQIAGKRVVFEPHAVVWAEEPQDVTGLWKQRMRWARGNVQVTSRFRRVWFRRGRWGRLGGVSFGLIWFTVTLMPVLMVAASAGLIALYLLDREASAHVFRALWAVNLTTYLFITLSSFSLDPQIARRAWREGIAFPGLISLAIIAYAGSPRLLRGRRRQAARRAAHRVRARGLRVAGGRDDRGLPRRAARPLRAPPAGSWRRWSTSWATGHCCARSPRARTCRSCAVRTCAGRRPRRSAGWGGDVTAAERDGSSSVPRSASSARSSSARSRSC